MAAWAIEAIEQLKHYILDCKYTAGEAGWRLSKEFGREYSRNAVIGQCYRRGISLENKTIVSHSSSYKPKKPYQQRFKEKLPPKQADPKTEVTDFRCTLMQLTNETCRWPIGEPAAKDFCFCGAFPVRGLPYCAYHCSMAYSAPVSRAQKSI